ncbi:MAG: NAD(P)H-dependent oxidoreductase [Patescibacteria group bacterium]
MNKLKILAISGSLRKYSINTGLLKAVVGLGGDDMEITLADISTLPMYNQDLEASFPEVVTNLKKQISEADGVIIATPEFNRSIPGALKNMLDWTSRPYGDATWKGKPVATMGATTSTLGTGLAQYHLKQILLYLNTHVLGQPEFYLNASEKFDKEGNLTDEKTKEHIKKLLDVFGQHIKS